MAGHPPLTVAGELISGNEMYDEKDLDAALARFDELTAQGADSVPDTG